VRDLSVAERDRDGPAVSYVSFWIAGAAIQAIHAQAKPPVYMIAIFRIGQCFNGGGLALLFRIRTRAVTLFLAVLMTGTLCISIS
jgi:hypothetical protein